MELTLGILDFRLAISYAIFRLFSHLQIYRLNPTNTPTLELHKNETKTDLSIFVQM